MHPRHPQTPLFASTRAAKSSQVSGVSRRVVYWVTADVTVLLFPAPPWAWSVGLAQPPEAVAAEGDFLAWAVRRVGVTERLPHPLPVARILRVVRQPDLGGLG